MTTSVIAEDRVTPVHALRNSQELGRVGTVAELRR